MDSQPGVDAGNVVTDAIRTYPEGHFLKENPPNPSESPDPLKYRGSRDAEIYSMEPEYERRCVIFNYTEIRGLKPREGTEKDVEVIENTFEKLNFRVDIHHDLGITKLKATLNALKTESKEDNYDVGCLVIFFLTHGDEEVLYCKNQKAITIKEILENFSADKCKGLAGKPKLFFIQACRGVETTQGTKLHTDSKSKTSNIFSIPKVADFLVCYSTYSGYTSYRDPNTGSFFIQALCAVLRQHSREKDLLSMLTITNRRVAQDIEVPGPDKTFKQMPCFDSTLTRQVYFKPFSD